MLNSHYRTCNLCEAMCGLVIETENGQVKSIKGDADDPFSKGHICPKATALQDIYEDPDRLKTPVRRTADGWEAIGWDEAFDEVAKNLQTVQAQHGNNALGLFVGNPTVHNTGSMLFGPPFIRALRTKNRFSATSVDQLPHMFAALLMFGHQLLLPVPDVDRTDFFLILGANPLASNGSLMTAPGIANRLKALQKRGGKVIVVDPRRTETAAIADAHYFIRPGTDVLLMLGLLHTVFAENLESPGRLADFTDGFEAIREIVTEFAPEAVAPLTGIPAEQIRQLARDFAGAERAVCYGRMGVSTQAFGGVVQWLMNVLNIVTGNFDRPGGAMFTLPAFDVVGITAMTGQNGHFGRWVSRVRGLPEFGGELPAAALAEEILTPGEGQIRALVTMAGNPVLSTPNGQQLDRALAGLDYMVAIDIYINETTRHANIILPPATGLESEHYDLAFHYLAVRNTTKYSDALYPPGDGRLHDWQILNALRQRLEGDKPVQRKDYLRRLPPHKIIDLALRFGPYGAWGGRRGQGDGLTLRKVRQQPHGIDLGPLTSLLPERLNTPDKRIQLAPQLLQDDLQRVRETFLDTSAQQSTGSLLLIGRRHLRSNNSWMHNSPRLVRGKNRCTLMIHPDDARLQGIADGQMVQVSSRVGSVEVEAEITPDIMPGVVSIPHGWGHNRPGTRLKVAQEHAGVSLNDLTDECELDTLTGNAAFSGIPVNIQALVQVEA